MGTFKVDGSVWAEHFWVEVNGVLDLFGWNQSIPGSRGQSYVLLFSLTRGFKFD